ncbi:hypothetical protein LEMLEM_LOCUS13762, partial [Lemmus lemmus]
SNTQTQSNRGVPRERRGAVGISLQQWSKRSKTTEDLRKMGFQRLEIGLWSPCADAASVLWKLKVHRDMYKVLETGQRRMA